MIGSDLSYLGNFQLESPLGSGASGEVYRARDLKLDRSVAVKILRAELTSDGERLRRFEREARSASALNHPNIVHIYEIGRSNGMPYIAMELVEGRTLREIAAEAPIPVRQAIDLASQTADGLAKAHANGIVHRDLKPENLILSDDGFVKILDFGLAKLTGPDSEDAPLQATRTGTILGTAGYMSPEQARGGSVDFRSDQFSFGLILYELLTGRRAFSGETFAETLVAIIRTEPPPVESLAPSVPPPLRAIVERCLAKEPSQRFERTRHLADELRTLKSRSPESAEITTSARISGTFAASEGSLATAPALPREPRKPPGRLSPATLGVLGLLGAGLLSVALLVLGPKLWRGSQPEEPEAEVASPPEELASDGVARVATEGRLRILASSQFPDRVLDPALSSDGKVYAYVSERQGQSDLFVSRVAGGAHIRLTDDAARESTPVFSPNGELLAFVRQALDEPTELCLIPTLGGAVRRVMTGAAMPTWSPDGEKLAFIFRQNGRPQALVTAGLDGSELEILLESGGRYPFLYSPAWSPDGRLLAVQRSTGGVAGEIWLIPLDGGPPRRAFEGSTGAFEHNPQFTADGGALVFASNRTGATNLWLRSLKGGQPLRLTSGPGPDLQASLADTGALTFLNTTWRYSLRLIRPDSGEIQDLVIHSSFLWAPAFSLDGERIAFSQAQPDGSWQVWSGEIDDMLAGDMPQQLTNSPAGAVYPRFTPDGEAVLYTTWNAPKRVYRQPLRGGTPTLLTPEGGAYADISPDGERIAYVRQVDGEERIFVRRIDGEEARALTETSSSLPRWSPDGRHIAFSPDRSWVGGVFVVDAGLDGDDGRGETRRLTETGGWPTWWPDGSRVGFLVMHPDGGQRIRSVPIGGGEPSEVQAASFHSTNHPFAVSPDGTVLAATDSTPLADEVWILEPPEP